MNERLTVLRGLMAKELLALRRDPHSLAALFVMPLAFIVLMTLALQNFYEAPHPPARYAVVDDDGGPAARSLIERWRREIGADQPLPADWRGALARGELGYVLEVQPGFSKRLQDFGSPAGTAQVRLHLEPGADNAALLITRAQLERRVGELRAHLLTREMAPMGLSADPSIAGFVEALREDRGVRLSAAQHNVPAWLVFGMFFVVTAMGHLFVEERRCGALARLRSLGVGPLALLLAKALPYLGVNLLQAALMLAVGVRLMPHLGTAGLTMQGVDLPALFLALGSISAAAVGLGLFLASLLRTNSQALAVGPLVNIILGALGGIMVPTFVMPHAMQTLARLSPMNWALEALLTVLVRGGHPVDLVPHVLPLLALAGVSLLGATLLLHRRPALPG